MTEGVDHRQWASLRPSTPTRQACTLPPPFLTSLHSLAESSLHASYSCSEEGSGYKCGQVQCE